MVVVAKHRDKLIGEPDLDRDMTSASSGGHESPTDGVTEVRVGRRALQPQRNPLTTRRTSSHEVTIDLPRVHTPTPRIPLTRQLLAVTQTTKRLGADVETARRFAEAEGRARIAFFMGAHINRIMSALLRLSTAEGTRDQIRPLERSVR